MHCETTTKRSRKVQKDTRETTALGGIISRSRSWVCDYMSISREDILKYREVLYL